VPPVAWVRAAAVAVATARVEVQLGGARASQLEGVVVEERVLAVHGVVLRLRMSGLNGPIVANEE
jgi:hypothetical protein